MIYDGARRWLHDRRVRKMVVLYVLLGVLAGFILGVIFGHLFSLWFAHEILAKASVFYREAVMRGDAAMAMLQRAAKELESLGNGKRVVLADDLNALKNFVGGGAKDVVVKKV